MAIIKQGIRYNKFSALPNSFAPLRLISSTTATLPTSNGAISDKNRCTTSSLVQLICTISKTTASAQHSKIMILFIVSFTLLLKIILLCFPLMLNLFFLENRIKIATIHKSLKNHQSSSHYFHMFSLHKTVLRRYPVSLYTILPRFGSYFNSFVLKKLVNLPYFLNFSYIQGFYQAQRMMRYAAFLKALITHMHTFDFH